MRANANETTIGAKRGFGTKIAVFGAAAVAGIALGSAPANAQLPDAAGSLVQATGSGESEPIAQNAPEGGSRLITLGDSVMAGDNLPYVDAGKGCYHSTRRYVAEIARSLDVYKTPDFQDASCFGATLDSDTGGIRLVDQTANMRDRGAFGPRTEHVLIQAGLNDYWGAPRQHLLDTATNCAANVVQGCDMNAVAEGRSQDPDAITADEYTKRAKTSIDFIKYYAPNAKISIVGYPTYQAPGERTCISVGGAPAEQPRDEVLDRLFRNMQSAQAGAAANLGVNFIDLKTPTAEHGGCTDQPWVGGLLDPKSEFNGIPLHLNPAGEVAAFNIVRPQI